MKYVFRRLYTLYIASVSIFSVSTVLCLPTEQGIPAFVTVPVANVVNTPFDATDANVLTALYRNLSPVEPKNNNSHTRRYQLLFNELVYVHDIKNGQAKIEIPHILHHHEHDTTVQQYYWMRADQLMPLSRITAKKSRSAIIPPTIIRGQCEPVETLSRARTIVLAMPFTDPGSNITFSAGTRFVQAPLDIQKNNDAYAVYRFDYHTGCVYTMHIPRSLTLVFSAKTSLEQRIDCFVNLIKSWANVPHGFIPYVWGGASFTHVITTPNRALAMKPMFPTSHVGRQSREAYGTFTHGFDCSCLISRAALACGLPYYLGNSTSIAQLAQPLSPGHAIKKGDIVWFPGHVLVVSDVEKNLILEARGYGAGFGRVHELPLHKVFKGVKTYKQLAHAYKAKKPLMLLNAQGENRLLLKHYTIFNLRESCRCQYVDGVQEVAPLRTRQDAHTEVGLPGG